MNTIRNLFAGIRGNVQKETNPSSEGNVALENTGAASDVLQHGHLVNLHDANCKGIFTIISNPLATVPETTSNVDCATEVKRSPIGMSVKRIKHRYPAVNPDDLRIEGLAWPYADDRHVLPFKNPKIPKVGRPFGSDVNTMGWPAQGPKEEDVSPPRPKSVRVLTRRRTYSEFKSEPPVEKTFFGMEWIKTVDRKAYQNCLTPFIGEPDLGSSEIEENANKRSRLNEEIRHVCDTVKKMGMNLFSFTSNSQS